MRTLVIFKIKKKQHNKKKEIVFVVKARSNKSDDD